MSHDKHDSKGGTSIFIKILIPVVLAIVVAGALFFPRMFNKATNNLQNVLTPNGGGNLQEGMLTWAELEKERRYTSLAEALRNPDEVRILDLSHQKLREVPIEIAQFRKLQILELQDNLITNLPKEIGYLNFLQYLHLRKNRITRLNSDLGNLKYLTYLDLSANNLKEIVPELGELYNLEELDLRFNQIRTVPTIG